MDSKQFNKLVDDVFDALGKASDESNTVDRTTYYIGVAQTRALLAVVPELKELREVLDKRCVVTPAASADVLPDHASMEPRNGLVPELLRSGSA